MDRKVIRRVTQRNNFPVYLKTVVYKLFIVVVWTPGNVAV